MVAALEEVTQGERLRSRRAGAAILHEVRYRAGASMPPHSHRTANITLLIGGDLRESVDDGGVTARALSVVFKPSGVEHSTAIGARGLRSFVIELDPRTERALRRKAGVFDRCRWIEDPDLAASLAGLWARQGVGPEAEEVTGHWLQELPRLWAAAIARYEHSPRPRAVEQALDRLESDFDRPLGPADIADEVGMHPASVTRLFTRTLGSGVKAWLRAIRVRHAANHLALTDSSMTRIALENGFCDQAHFCRDFRRTLGLTPGVYRRLSRA